MASISSPANSSSRKPAARGAAFGTKLLIGAVSISATLGGWAYIALFNPAQPETPDTATIIVSEPNGSMQALVLPTIEPVVGLDDLPAQQTQVQVQPPVVQKPLRSVTIPSQPLARSRSSR